MSWPFPSRCSPPANPNRYLLSQIIIITILSLRPSCALGFSSNPHILCMTRLSHGHPLPDHVHCHPLPSHVLLHDFRGSGLLCRSQAGERQPARKALSVSSASGRLDHIAVRGHGQLLTAACHMLTERRRAQVWSIAEGVVRPYRILVTERPVARERCRARPPAEKRRGGHGLLDNLCQQSLI